MLPRDALPLHTTNNRLIPRYLTEADRPWIEKTLDIYLSHVGRRRRELQTALASAQTTAGGAKSRALCSVLDKAFLPKPDRQKPKPQTVRQEVFRAAACAGSAKIGEEAKRILEDVAQSLGVTTAAVDERLFGDLPSERKISTPPQALDADTLRLKTNLAIVGGLLARSEAVRIRLRGRVLPLIRHARWRGLICSAHDSAKDPRIVLDISGPLSIVRRTSVYGRALAELVPYLSLSDDFELKARVCHEGARRILLLRSGDPIFPKEGLPRFDSRLESRFADDIQKQTDDWELIREPKPLRVGRGFVFPDFALRHKTVPGLEWLVEVVGFWTASYLAKKIEAYRNAHGRRIILCLRESQQCDEAAFPPETEVVRFKSRIDAKRVLGIVDRA